MKRKKFFLTIIILFSIVVVAVLVYINLSNNDFDIRDKAAEGEFNIDTYRGMARFGLGRLAECFVREQDLHEYDDFKFGWFHNWTYTKDYCGMGSFPVEIPESIDYYGLVGGASPSTTSCPNNLKQKIASYKDGDIIWVGNEIGYDDKRDPTTYATQYKSWYDCIKSVNPNIKVAPGANPGYPRFTYRDYTVSDWEINTDPSGRWSPTKLINYIEYISYAMNDYVSIYGEQMPIDAFVIHLYPCNHNGDCHNMSFVEEELRNFRTFMKSVGGSTKPLIIDEMATLDNSEFDDEQKSSMSNLYNLLLNLKDADIGNPNDNNRLVQRWAWFYGPDDCSPPDYTECTWSWTSYFKCCKIEDQWWTANCSVFRETTEIGEYHKEYVSQIFPYYDYYPPEDPVINYSLSGNTANVNFSAEDPGRINNYEISVGSSSGETDVMLWTSTDTSTSYTINNAIGKYVNVKAIDDGYNWSNVSSILIEEQEEEEQEEEEQEEEEEDGEEEEEEQEGDEPEDEDQDGSQDQEEGENGGSYDIAPKNNPDGKVDIYDLQVILINWKWKKENRDEEADVNDDGEVNIFDMTELLRHWTKKY